MDLITAGDLDIDVLDLLRQLACQAHGDGTTQGVYHRSDNLLTTLNLHGVVGGNSSPELRGSWTLDNQLKMFTTICHFSSEIFNSCRRRQAERSLLSFPRVLWHWCS